MRIDDGRLMLRLCYQCRNCRKTVVQSFDFIDKWKQYAKDAQPA